MKFELIEDINYSLENEYDELQSYLSSTVDKLKEVTATLENISKSYNGVNYRQLKQSASRSTAPTS